MSGAVWCWRRMRRRPRCGECRGGLRRRGSLVRRCRSRRLRQRCGVGWMQGGRGSRSLCEREQSWRLREGGEAMTVNETSFFRDMQTFEMLRGVILPSLMQEKRMERRLRIWSAASSTGQEAYSLAMLIVEHFPELAQWDVKIVGTDISRQVVDYAQRARYRRLEVNRGLPARLLVKYMTRDGEEWEVCEQIRRMCSFQYANLCAPMLQLPEFDLVLLRNVLLYFSQHDRRILFTDVHRKMTSTGYLLLGNAEQAEDSTNLFEVEFAANCYFYRPVNGS